MAELDDDACLDIRIRHEDDAYVLHLAGDIDLSTAPKLREAVAGAATVPPTPVTLDLANVTFMDSSGLSVLLELAASPAPLVIRSPSDTVRRVVQITGVADTLGMQP